MHTALIECLANYKVHCEFNNTDFDADKALQYQVLRKEMARRYSNEDYPFGPVEVSEKRAGELNDDEKKIYNDLLKKEQKEIAQGYNRILEKVKMPFNHNGSYQANQGGQMPINMTSQQNVPPTFQYMGNE